MATVRPHELHELARAIQAETEGDAKELAAAVLHEALPDTHQVSRPQYVAWFRRQWVTDARFAQEMLDRLAPVGPTGQRPAVGLKAFIATVKEAFSVDAALTEGAAAQGSVVTPEHVALAREAIEREGAQPPPPVVPMLPSLVAPTGPAPQTPLYPPPPLGIGSG